MTEDDDGLCMVVEKFIWWEAISRKSIDVAINQGPSRLSWIYPEED